MAKDPKTGRELPKGISWKADKETYMARFTHQGEQYCFYDKDLKTLKKTLSEKRYEVEHGLQGKADKITLNAWYKVWLDEYKIPTLKESTVHVYKQTYTNYIQPTLGNKLLSQLKPLHIQKTYNALSDRGLSAKTIANIQGMLYDILEIACNNDLIIKNPCRSVTRPKLEKSDRRVLLLSEQYALQSYLKQDKWQAYEALIITLLGTGMRIGEALGLTWNDIDFEHNQVSINKALVYVKDLESGKYTFKNQSPKTKDSIRTIPLLSDVSKALKHHCTYQKRCRLYAGGDWKPLQGFENIVFTTSNGTPRQESDIRKALNRIVAEINADEQELALKEHREPFIMEHVHPHALRHTFATRCFERGIPPKTVQGFLGHSTVQISMDIYTHLTEQAKQDDMQKLEGLLNVVNGG